MGDDYAGRFRKKEDLIGQGGENGETWLECVYCTSDSELEFHKLKRKHDKPSKRKRSLKRLLQTYYLPQLKFTMKSSKEFAFKCPEKSDMRSHHLGAFNAYEIAIGCIQEAIKSSEGKL